MAQDNLKIISMYYLIGTLFNKGISFLTVPVFTRLLNTSDYGIVTTFNSWVTILSMIFGFAIYMGIRAAFVDYEKEINDVLSVTTIFTLLSGLIISLIIIVISFLFQNKNNLILIILCCVQGISYALIQNYLMFLMMKYKYKMRTALMILPNLISAVISIITVIMIVHNHRYWGRIVPTTIIYVFFGIFVFISVFKNSHMYFNQVYLIYTLKISAPLVLHGIALNILSQSDLTMITWLADSSQAGIYSLIYNFSMIATVITTSLDGVWVPWFTNKLKTDQKKAINDKVVDYIYLMTISLIVVVLIGPEVVKLLASSNYWEGITIIPPIVIANYLVFSYTLYVNIEHFHKKTIYITINTLIAASSNILLNYFLVPKFGYIAAAYTTVISYLIAFILHTLYAKKLEPQLYPLNKFLFPLIQLFFATLIFYIFINYWYIRWIVVIIYLLVIGWIERKKIAIYKLIRTGEHHK